MGWGPAPATPAEPVPASSGSPTVTPPPANVPRKAKMGRPARVAKSQVSPQTAVAGPKKLAPGKPPVTRSQTKNQPASKMVAVADPEGDATAPVDAEYETDELAELPTESEPELVESEPGEEVTRNEEQ